MTVKDKWETSNVEERIEMLRKVKLPTDIAVEKWENLESFIKNAICIRMAK